MSEVNLEFLRVGDTIVFANGTTGVCTVCYNNGGEYFLRWDVPGKDWSGTDAYCCDAGVPKDGRRGIYTEPTYLQSPYDIVDIIKPPLHELQDKITALTKKLAEKEKLCT